MLTLALTVYEESLCSGCGQDKSISYNPDAEGWFEAREVTCAGCAAQQRHGEGSKSQTPGGKLFVVDTRPAELVLRPWSLSVADDQTAD